MTPFDFFKIFSDVLQESNLGLLSILIHINNLSNDIVSLVQQKCTCSRFYIHQLDLDGVPSNSTESAFFD